MKSIKVFSDYACPFCYIGFSIGERLKDEGFDIQWIPYFLAPDAPLEGESLLDKIPEDQLDFAFKRINRLASEYGLVYNNRHNKFNTNRLHKAGLYAEELGKYYEFSKEAFRYIFELGKNVGLREVVDEIASKVGLDVEEMNEKIDQGAYDSVIHNAIKLSDNFNIESVPSFVLEDGRVVSLLKDYERFKKDLLK